MSNPKQTIRSVQISKAKSSLNSLVKRVHRDHEYLILKDNGTPLAAVTDIDEFEDYLEVNDPKVRKAIELSNEDIREGRTRPAREFLEELRREERTQKKATRRREGLRYSSSSTPRSLSAPITNSSAVTVRYLITTTQQFQFLNAIHTTALACIRSRN